MAEISRAAPVIVRSGRSTRPATSHPSPIESAAIDHQRDQRHEREHAHVRAVLARVEQAHRGPARGDVQVCSSFSADAASPRSCAGGAARDSVWITGAGNACEYAPWVRATAAIRDPQQGGAGEEEQPPVEHRQAQADRAPRQGERSQSAAQAHGVAQIR